MIALGNSVRAPWPNVRSAGRSTPKNRPYARRQANALAVMAARSVDRLFIAKPPIWTQPCNRPGIASSAFDLHLLSNQHANVRVRREFDIDRIGCHGVSAAHRLERNVTHLALDAAPCDQYRNVETR